MKKIGPVGELFSDLPHSLGSFQQTQPIKIRCHLSETRYATCQENLPLSWFPPADNPAQPQSMTVAFVLPTSLKTFPTLQLQTNLVLPTSLLCPSSQLQQTPFPKHRPCLPKYQAGCPPKGILHFLGATTLILFPIPLPSSPS